MTKKLTITIADEVYEGLYRRVGRRRISRFLEALARPHVVEADLEDAHRAMAGGEVREAWTDSRTRMAIDLPDELVAAAQERAAEESTSLESLLARGLRRELDEAPSRGEGAGRTLRLPVVDGGLPPELDIADRVAMHEWLRTHS